MSKGRVFITGGASGLGKATAHKYASEGFQVCIGDVHQERGLETEQELKAIQSECFFIQCDVTDRNSIKAVKNELEQRWGGIDILINNAGIVGTVGHIDTVNVDDWKLAFDINLFGVARCCEIFVPLFKKIGGGQIINIASAAGIVQAPMMANYNANKTAVIALSETLHLELVRDNIDISVVCPSFFPTNLTESLSSPINGLDNTVNRFMKGSKLSADDVASIIFEKSQKKQFMIITHTVEKIIWRVKRFMPNVFYKLARKRTKQVFDKFDAKNK